jgi:cytochrome c peroxidase
VATTAPYFHDGSASTLAEAVKSMGVAQLDRMLTDQQISAIVAFLNTLTGTYRDHAVSPATAASRAGSVRP